MCWNTRAHDWIYDLLMGFFGIALLNSDLIYKGNKQNLFSISMNQKKKKVFFYNFKLFMTGNIYLLLQFTF